ncbi:MAG: hypothetical protein C4334_14615 [Pyrinomonas sp.]
MSGFPKALFERDIYSLAESSLGVSMRRCALRAPLICARLSRAELWRFGFERFAKSASLFRRELAYRFFAQKLQFRRELHSFCRSRSSPEVRTRRIFQKAGSSYTP